MEEKLNINIPEFDQSKLSRIVGLALLLFLLWNSIYTIDANANGVILRFGKYSSTQMPGIHLKLPFIDSVYKVRVAHQFKEEFGFRTVRPGIKTTYSSKKFYDESWTLTGDLKIAEVRWVVQYKIKDAKDYLFNVKNPENTIRDASEATMRFMIGDRSFSEVMQTERKSIGDNSKIHMQGILDSYKSGISVQLVQLQGVVPPDPVADSFNEVNRAKQEQETLINQAWQAYAKKIYNVEGTAERMINEAQGYAIERVNNAKGDAALFDKVLIQYNKAPEITRDRLYIEAMENVLGKISHKVIVDPNLENFLPLMKIESKGGN